ncbi:MAG: hypothetical protein V1858_05075 [Candidatus Gottesmanbacteria bacterium]
MTTIVNSQAPPAEAKGYGFLIGIIVLVGFVAVLMYFVIPATRRIGPVQVSIPATQVVLPDKVNVNIVQPK